MNWFVIKVNDKFLGAHGELTFNEYEAINFHEVDKRHALIEVDRLRKVFGGNVELIPNSTGC